jgi:3-dehydroquinate dehydratase-1
LETLKLGKHKVRTPAVCASVLGENVDAMAARMARAIEEQADIIEIRLDGLRKNSEWETLLETELPLILTNRAEREGGHFKGDDGARIRYLLKGIEEGAPCVDIELSTPHSILNKVIETAKMQKTSLLLTHHDFKETPPIATLMNIAEKMAGGGCDIAKIVTFARAPRDALAVLNFLNQVPSHVKVPVVAFAMGEAGRISRIAAPLFGSPIVYAAVKETTAPGQFDVEKTRLLLHDFGLR